MTVIARDVQALISAHREGDPSAFSEIVLAHRASLTAHAQRRLRDPEAARDAVQETFLRALRAIDRFGGELFLGAWLHRILDNVCNDEVVRRHREADLAERVAALAVEHAPPPAEGDGIATSAVRVLPDRYRETLVLRAIDDLSFRDVAARTGVSEANARARFHRARAIVRRLLDGPAALAVPLAAFAGARLRRIRPVDGDPGAANLAGSPIAPGAPSAASSLLSSSVTTHVVTEVAAAPERASIVAKVLLTAATALPVAAAAAPGVSARPTPARAPAAVVDAGLIAPAGAVPVASVGASQPSVVPSAAPAADAAVPVPAAPVTIGAMPQAEAPIDAPAADDPLTASVGGAGHAIGRSGSADTLGTAPPARPVAAEPEQWSTGRIELVAPAASAVDDWRVDTDAVLEIGGEPVAGHLVVKVHRAGDGTRTFWTSFVTAEGAVLTAEGADDATCADVDASGTFAGAYHVDAGAAAGLAPAGAFVASVRHADGAPDARLTLTFRAPRA